MGTVAEYFRDEEGQDVLLFIDNIFRFTQAGSEVSALLGRIPSAVGYLQHLQQIWEAYKNVLPPPLRVPLPPCKLYTCPLTILPILLLLPPLRILTPPLCSLVVSLS